ncbi:MAG: PilW family protein [Nitrosomonas sp.]|nr:MAG: PilW family protein [Nitrosomonas sp.]
MNGRHSGFSLLELMISVAIGMFIMTGVLALYLDITRSNAELAKINRQIENGRFTIQLLQQELWHAGFWDSFAPPLPSVTAPLNIPNPCIAFADWSATDTDDMYLIPVQGYANGIGVPSECGGIVANKQANSDVLVVRYANTCIADAVNCENYDANKLYLQTQGCSDTGATGYYDPGAANKPILDATGNKVVYKKNCTTMADKRKIIISIFYVRNYSSVSNDGIPTLMRADFGKSGDSVTMKSAQPLIEGIQSIKFEYGRDTDNDGSPDVFDDCIACTALDWAQVVAVQMHVLARNLEASVAYVDGKTYRLGDTTLGPFSDGYMRHVYSSYVRLVNPSGRRERP